MIRSILHRILQRLHYWRIARRDAADWRTTAHQIAHVRTWE